MFVSVNVCSLCVSEFERVHACYCVCVCVCVCVCARKVAHLPPWSPGAVCPRLVPAGGAEGPMYVGRSSIPLFVRPVAYKSVSGTILQSIASLFALRQVPY